MPSAPSLSKKQYEVLARFRYEMRRFLRRSEELVRGHGMTPLQYQLLLQIKGYPGREYATLTELAERLQARHHGVVSLVNRCEAAGLLQRRRAHEDRRQVYVALTSKGMRALARLVDLHAQELLQLQGELTVPGRRDLKRVP